MTIRVRRRAGVLALALSTALATATVTPSPALGASTVPAAVTVAGPGPITGGQVEGIADGLVTGAVQAVVADPGDADTAWVGTVNGGVWRTSNATAGSPTWVPLTDALPDISIGALTLDPTVPTNRVLLAGLGNYSSNNRVGSALTGLLRTTDGGATWTRLGTAALAGQGISGVAARGATLVASSTNANGGVFRSTDSGATFTRISGAAGSGLPAAGAFDLVGDPLAPTRLYAATTSGVFRSEDSGGTWTAAGGTQLGTGAAVIDGTTNNIEMSVHATPTGDVVYVGVINSGQLNRLLASTDRGATWTAMDSPSTNEGGTVVGLQPRVKPGSQGGIHFSILSDRTNANVVYLGGDRQPLGAGGTWPNSIGAGDFTGRLFRCDRSLAAGSQCTPITHNGTANNSAPHADSRDMVWDANGDMIEVDDGGVYRQSDPATAAGVWTSAIGNLQVAEHHSCDWDDVARIAICGDQDTGTPEQSAAGSASWRSVTTADGGVVAVDDVDAAESVRYSSTQNLGGRLGRFFRRTCDAANTCSGNIGLGLVVAGTGGQNLFATDSTIQFYTPITANRVARNRLVVGTGTVYESLDRGDNLTVLSTATGAVTALAYGGRSAGTDNPGLLFVGSTNGLYLRSGQAATLTRLASYPGGAPTAIALHPENWLEAVVLDGARALRTTDGGGTWTDVTGDLGAAAAGTLRSAALVPAAGQVALVVGADRGLYFSQTQNLGRWARFAPQVPTTLVAATVYEPGSDLLLVGTHGRGSYTIPAASGEVPQADLSVTKTDSPDPVMAGDELFYTVTVRNNGPDTAYDAVLTDTLPASLTYLSDSLGCSLDAPTRVLTCALGDLAAGASRSLTIKTRVLSGAVAGESDGTTRITNTASVTSVSVDPSTADNTATTSTFVQELADLAVSKLCVPDGQVDAGETAKCTVYVDNFGPSDARQVSLTDTHTSNGSYTFGAITPSQGTCSSSGDVVSCAFGVLPAASPSTVGRASVTIEIRASEAVDIDDVARVVAATPDPDSSDNTKEERLSVRAVSDLALTKTGPATAVAGTAITYALGVTNGGPSTATGVRIADVLPLGVSVTSVSGSGGATCSGGRPGDADNPTTCSFGPLAPGDSRTMSITATIAPDAVGTLVNSARASSDVFDKNSANNLGRVETALSSRADLGVGITATPNPVTAGDVQSYQVTVRNTGPSLARNASVQVSLPAALRYTSSSVALAGSCGLLTSTNTVSCELGDLQPGQRAVITVYTVVNPSTPDGSTLQATAVTTSDTTDPGPAANSASVATRVIAVADLAMRLTSDGDVYKPSTIIHYTLTVTNRGLSDAQGVTVSQTLPDKKTAAYDSNDGGCPAPAGTVFTCSLGTLRAGETRSVQLNLLIRGNKRTITQTATTASSTTDPDTTNNSDTRVVTVK